MTFSSALVGGGIGFCVQMFSNSIRKVPLSRKPWLHVLFFGAGCYAGNKYPKIEAKLVNDINRARVSRGQKPIVGSNGWIGYTDSATFYFAKSMNNLPAYTYLEALEKSF